MRCRVVGVIVTLTLSLLPAPLTANAQPSRNLALLSPRAFSPRRTKSSAEPCAKTIVFSDAHGITSLSPNPPAHGTTYSCRKTTFALCPRDE
jgi:hypothetical protein